MKMDKNEVENLGLFLFLGLLAMLLFIVAKDSIRSSQNNKTVQDTLSSNYTVSCPHCGESIEIKVVID